MRLSIGNAESKSVIVTEGSDFASVVGRAELVAFAGTFDHGADNERFPVEAQGAADAGVAHGNHELGLVFANAGPCVFTVRTLDEQTVFDRDDLQGLTQVQPRLCARAVTLTLTFGLAAVPGSAETFGLILGEGGRPEESQSGGDDERVGVDSHGVAISAPRAVASGINNAHGAIAGH